MGQLVAKLAEPLQYCGGSVVEMLGARRKRKRSFDSSSSGDGKKYELQSPKRKKLLTTTQYIYQTLFKEQTNADIAVMALDKVWNLHKVYLSQSPYFYSMFNGSWKESSQDFVHIKILDERITNDALDAVFGSMYSDEIEIDRKAVVSVLATATLFQLDGIIDKCAEVMVETINTDTSIDYYEASCQYGTMNVKKAAFQWLETNLLCIYSKYLKLVRGISIDLMTALISSPDLYVMQTEFSLYTLLRTWVYLCLHPSYDPDNPQHQQNCETENPNDVIQAYFAARTDQPSFLATPEGQEYLKPFQALRTQYLTNHNMDLRIVLNDNIIPKEWLHCHILSHWTTILKVDHMPEVGPQNIDPDVFFQNCMRCGRILLEPGYQKWRWTGFNFGLDLILICDSRTLSIRRHHRNEHERILSLQTKRQFMIRTAVTAINYQRHPVFTQKSDISSLSLERNEEVTLMIMHTKLVHPLLVSVNLLVVPPTSQRFKENTLIAEEANATTPRKPVPITDVGAICERSSTPQTPEDSTDDSAVCLLPPTPTMSELLPPPTHRSSSTVSTSSLGSTVSSSSVPSVLYLP